MSYENGPSKIRWLVFLPQRKARHRDKAPTGLAAVGGNVTDV
jgi:hypothetical protein